MFAPFAAFLAFSYFALFFRFHVPPITTQSKTRRRHRPRPDRWTRRQRTPQERAERRPRPCAPADVATPQAATARARIGRRQRHRRPVGKPTCQPFASWPDIRPAKAQRPRRRHRARLDRSNADGRAADGPGNAPSVGLARVPLRTWRRPSGHGSRPDRPPTAAPSARRQADMPAVRPMAGYSTGESAAATTSGRRHRSRRAPVDPSAPFAPGSMDAPTADAQRTAPGTRRASALPVCPCGRQDSGTLRDVSEV